MGIFDPARLFAAYTVTLQFHDRVAGGVPRDPKVMEGWLMLNIPGITPDEILAYQIRTMREMGVPVPDGASTADMHLLAEQLGEMRSVNGFKRDTRGGLYIESRQVKALLKEVTNILFAGDRWKAPGQKTQGKGPRSFLAERVFINPDRIYLGRQVADDVETTFGHVMGPQGPRTMISRFEVCHQPTVTFEVVSAQDAVDADHWPNIWLLGEQNGLGSSRSQGYGRFETMEWKKLDRPTQGFHGQVNSPALAAAIGD